MTTKTEGISIKATEKEKAAIDAAAEAAGVSRSALLIQAATAAGASDSVRQFVRQTEALGLLRQAGALIAKARELLA